MNRIAYCVILLLTVHIFSGCKKEQENGGISFSFTANQSIQLGQFSVSLSQQQYGTPVVSAATKHGETEITLTGIKPASYHWTTRIDYSTPGPSYGTYFFEGDIIIIKGKTMHITLEN